MALNQQQSSDGLNYNSNPSNIALEGAFKPPSQISNLTKNLLLLLQLLDHLDQQNHQSQEQQQQQQNHQSQQQHPQQQQILQTQQHHQSQEHQNQHHQNQQQVQQQSIQQIQQQNSHQSDPHARLQQQYNEHYSTSLNDFSLQALLAHGTSFVPQAPPSFQSQSQSQGEAFSNLVVLEPNYPPQPPSYSNSASSSLASHKFIPTSDFQSQSIPSHPSYDSSQNSQMPIPYQPASSFRSGSIAQSNNSFQQFNTPVNDSLNYIPSSHNTPTVISTSYSSNHSYTPCQVTNNFVPQSNSFQPSSSYKGIIPNAIPTTNLSMDSANSNSTRESLASLSFVVPTNGSQNNSHSSISQSSNPQNLSSPSVYIPPTLSQQGNSLKFSNSFSGASLGTNLFQNQQNQNQQNQQNQDQAQSQGHAQNLSHQSIQQQPAFYNRMQPSVNERTIGSNHTSLESTPTGNTPTISLQSNSLQSNNSSRMDSSLPPQSSSFFPNEPDHYMSYKEFLHNLSVKEKNPNDSNINNSEAITDTTGTDPNGSVYEEHLNIVDYPVNDLILMLSCLLSKIIEANDKLHPNHFDNTISIRQKLKEEKKLKKLQRANAREDRKRQLESRQTDDTNENSNKENEDNIDVDIDDHNCNTIEIADDDEDFDDDDEEDEMKNKYLANVLAFHGTNVPGISLHAYLSRVLKYCPVTNEVFLSLLVYFDRIAKKANNLKQKKRNNEETESESEQLFVMDSYNIHRLIISGITVSSKFFSDIFYKNLRYAKVGGLPLEELNYLELQFLLLLDFKLMISVEDLQNYGDLLLRFWKREQITNELVNPSSIKPQTEVPTFQN